MSKNKPEWLQALEAQSWQAELIASGLAIYGSLSLGTQLDGLTEWAVLRFNDRNLNILYFLFFYMYAAHAVLVISFISHLALRILWAGILGLSSVYPHGINLESKAYAPHFKEKLKNEFPDLSKYSLDLDKQCSMIFSVLCAMVIVLVCISFWLIAYIILSELLITFLPENVVSYIGFSLIGLFFLFSIINGLLIQGKLKDTSFAKKYAYKINQKFAKILYFFGYKAFNYISQTIRTNVTSKLFFVGMMALLFISMFMSIPRIQKMVPYYHADKFVSLNAHESLVSTANYLDKLERNTILQPVIQSEIIKESTLNLYIPKYKREDANIKSVYGIFEWDDDLPDQENLIRRNTFKEKIAKNYYTIFIDNVPIKNLDYQYRRRLYNNREGFQVFINIENLLQGSHTIKIESLYKNTDNITFRRSIPFYKLNK
jgi:hypothetical protein